MSRKLLIIFHSVCWNRDWLFQVLDDLQALFLIILSNILPPSPLPTTASWLWVVSSHVPMCQCMCQADSWNFIPVYSVPYLYLWTLASCYIVLTSHLEDTYISTLAFFIIHIGMHAVLEYYIFKIINISGKRHTCNKWTKECISV